MNALIKLFERCGTSDPNYCDDEQTRCPHCNSADFFTPKPRIVTRMVLRGDNKMHFAKAKYFYSFCRTCHNTFENDNNHLTIYV